MKKQTLWWEKKWWWHHHNLHQRCKKACFIQQVPDNIVVKGQINTGRWRCLRTMAIVNVGWLILASEWPIMGELIQLKQNPLLFGRSGYRFLPAQKLNYLVYEENSSVWQVLLQARNRWYIAAVWRWNWSHLMKEWHSSYHQCVFV